MQLLRSGYFFFARRGQIEAAIRIVVAFCERIDGDGIGAKLRKVESLNPENELLVAIADQRHLQHQIVTGLKAFNQPCAIGNVNLGFFCSFGAFERQGLDRGAVEPHLHVASAIAIEGAMNQLQSCLQTGASLDNDQGRISAAVKGKSQIIMIFAAQAGIGLLGLYQIIVMRAVFPFRMQDLV